jgi:hypothetical protein
VSFVLSCDLPVVRRDGASPSRLLTVPPGDDDPYSAVAAALVPTVREGAAVLAVLPAWDDDRGSDLHLQAVRSALDTTRVAVHRTTLPPLAAAWLVDLLAQLAADRRLLATDLVRALAELEAACAGAAWLGSVTKLQHPAPTLAMHARSWVRGAGFAAVVDRDPKVVPLRRGDDVMPLPAPPAAGWEIAVAIGDGDLARVERSLASHDNGAVTCKVPVGDVSRRWWGTDKLIELAFRPKVADTLADRLVTTRPATRCPWCDQHVDTAVCPFCQMRQPSPTADPLGGRA